MSTSYNGVAANATGTTVTGTVAADGDADNAAASNTGIKTTLDWLQRLANIALNIASTAWTWTALQTFASAVHVSGGNLTVEQNSLAGGELVADKDGANDGTLTNALRLGGPASGCGVTSNRSGAGANQLGLDFWTNFINRFSINTAGDAHLVGALAVGDISLAAESANIPTIVPITPGTNVANITDCPKLAYYADLLSGMVWVHGQVAISGAPADIVLGVVPVGFRPDHIAIGTCYVRTTAPADEIATVHVGINGNILIATLNLASNLTEAWFRIGYRKVNPLG